MYFRIDGTCSAIYSSYSGNEWHNITAVYNSQLGTTLNSIDLYLDGYPVNTISYNEAQDINTLQLSPLKIGQGNFIVPGHGMEFMNGEIDDIVIYNRALTPAEIQQLYTAQSYVWSNNATTTTITVTPTQNTTYSCTVTQGNQTCTASVDITVIPAITNAVSATIVQGQSYTLGTQTLTTAGTYTEVFTSAAGCDSTVTLTLAVEPLLTCNITTPTTTLCAGQSATLTVNTTGGAGASSQLPANLQQGLVAYYPFNGNANDESGNGNNGVVNGATLTADRFGNSGSAYSFDGVDDYIQGEAQTSLNMYSTLTISGWVNTSEVNQSRIFTYGSNDNILNFQYALFTTGVAGNLKAYFIANGENTNFEPEGPNVSNGNLNIAQWSMLTIVFNENFLEVWINGILDKSLEINDSFVQGNFPFFMIGKRSDNQEYFTGKIDDITIYNRALSPSEIQQLYIAQSYAWSNSASTPTSPSLPPKTPPTPAPSPRAIRRAQLVWTSR
jgi:hypothetical protein